MQLDIEDIAHGFAIQRDGNQFALVDRSTFNNWGALKIRFASRDQAELYAYNCDQFKRGRRSTIAK